MSVGLRFLSRCLGLKDSSLLTDAGFMQVIQIRPYEVLMVGLSEGVLIGRDSVDPLYYLGKPLTLC
jgi:hypothetical protein